MTDEQAKELGFLVEAWKKTVDVQQHFNQLCLSIRNLAITVLGAGLGSIPFLIKEHLTISIWGFERSLLGIILLLLALIWCGFYFFDRLWYHNFLKGASTHAGDLENKIKTIIPEWGLSNEIRNASNVTFWGKPLRSTQRLNLFYRSILAVLLITSLVAFLDKNLIYIPQDTVSKKGVVASIDSLLVKRDSVLLVKIRATMNVKPIVQEATLQTIYKDKLRSKTKSLKKTGT